MNSPIKTIILKEVKEVFQRGYYIPSVTVDIIILAVIGFIITLSVTGTFQKLFMEMSFIVAPTIVMFTVSLPFIQEKFGDEKLLRKFESLITTPIPLKKIWASKIASIFLLSYPSGLIVIIVLLLIWIFLKHLNPLLVMSAPVWIMALFIVPSLPLLFTGFASWSILRFNYPQLMKILQFMGLGICFFIILTSGNIINNIISEQIVNWSIVAYSIMGVIVAACLVLFLMNRLDKEKVTI